MNKCTFGVGAWCFKLIWFLFAKKKRNETNDSNTIESILLIQLTIYLSFSHSHLMLLSMVNVALHMICMTATLRFLFSLTTNERFNEYVQCKHAEKKMNLEIEIQIFCFISQIDTNLFDLKINFLISFEWKVTILSNRSNLMAINWRITVY